MCFLSVAVALAAISSSQYVWLFLTLNIVLKVVGFKGVFVSGWFDQSAVAC